MKKWFVYLLQSEKSGRTYVGIALDIERRLRQHNGHLKGGAKSTRAHRPWKVVSFFGPFDTRSEAQKKEYLLKSKKKDERLQCKTLSESKNENSP